MIQKINLNINLKINWRKVVFPIFDKLSNINNDESGSIIISKNNWDLAHNQEDYEMVLKVIDDNRRKNDVKDASTFVIINKSK